MSLSSNTNPETKRSSGLLGILIPVVVAILLTGLLSPFIASTFNLPLPSWMQWSQLYLGQPPGGDASNVTEDIDGATTTDELSDSDSEWPAPPGAFLASAGYVTSTGSITATATPAATARPTPTIFALPTPSWEEMSYLTTVKFTASTIVEAEREANIALFGNITTDRLLLKAVGEVLVGIDLSRVADIEIDGRSIRLSLPAPDVMAVELLPKESQIYDSSRTLFLSQYDGLETDALEQARQQLRIETTENDGLMELAQEMSRLQLIEFLESVGYRQIEVDFPYLDSTRELD